MRKVRVRKPITVSSPLSGDLHLRSMRGLEWIGRPFDYELELLATVEEVDLDALLGEAMSVMLELPDGSERVFHGMCSSFSHVGSLGRHGLYKAQLRPWFWLLSLSSDCRIWQDKTVPEIITELFDEFGFTDYREQLQGTYRPWVNCVQYCESAFEFISRLMEHEGIYYYWAHEDGKHTLVLCDAPSAHETSPGYETIPFYPESPDAMRERDHIFDWKLSRHVQSGSFDVRSFDFTSPSKDLDGRHEIQRDHARASFERYSYEQVYDTGSDAADYARVRLEQLQSEFEVGEGRASARGISPGYRFSMTGHPRADQNRDYVVISAQYQLMNDSFESGVDSGGVNFECSFRAIEASTPYRPARTTQRPRIQGPQTAIVTGAAGDEICTDEYGRVKVRFHWDRHNQNDDQSSCWIRVGQVWAGQGWGGIHVPRVGHEVIVEFLDGDPDRPSDHGLCLQR